MRIAALGGSGYEKPQPGLRPLCGYSPPHFLRWLERFAFLYRNRKNVAYSRNVMCNVPKKYYNS
jgi:hypothetical protein